MDTGGPHQLSKGCCGSLSPGRQALCHWWLWWHYVPEWGWMLWPSDQWVVKGMCNIIINQILEFLTYFLTILTIMLQAAALCTGRAGACVVHLKTSWLGDPHLAHPGCTDTEYPFLQAHGWFTYKCPCDLLQQQQTKHYKTASTSTEPTPSCRAVCANCDVPRRSTPPAHIGFHRTASPVGAVGGVGYSPPGRNSASPPKSGHASPRAGGSPRSSIHSPSSKAVSPLHSNAHSPPCSGTSSPRGSPRFSPGSPQVVSPPRSLSEGPGISRLVSTASGPGGVMHLSNMTVVNVPRGNMPYNRALVPSASADTITCRHHMALEDPYVNLNPCYKSTTPPEDVLGYPIMTQPMSFVEFTPASLPSLPEATEKCEHAPPRSSTAPNVRGLDEDLTESDLWQQRGLSPRASWAGPETCTDDPLAHCMSTSASWHIYDEVYIPARTVSPEPPERSSSLPQQPIYEPVLRASRPRLDMFGQRIPQRSMSQQAVYNCTPAGYQLRGSTPAIRMDETDSPRGAYALPAPAWAPPSPVSPPYAEVWVPQIQPKQSASFINTPSAKPSQGRLSQSCEHLSSMLSGASISGAKPAIQPSGAPVGPTCSIASHAGAHGAPSAGNPSHVPSGSQATGCTVCLPSTDRGQPCSSYPGASLASNAPTSAVATPAHCSSTTDVTPDEIDAASADYSVAAKNGNTSKRRCPTPPRVLSPSVDNYQCQDIADI